MDTVNKSEVSTTATTTMKTVVGYLKTMDKAELSKSELRISIGNLVPKLRAEYGKNTVSALKDECGKANVRNSISIGTLNVWACIAMFHKVNPAIDKLSERLQRKFATLYDASVTKNGESPKLKSKANIPASVKKMEFPALRDIASDDGTFQKTFGIKAGNTNIPKVTETFIANMFSRLRKMKDTERDAMIALIKKELSTPIKVKGKNVKRTVNTIPVPAPSVPAPTPAPAPSVPELVS